MKAFAVAAWVGLSICAAAQTTPAAPHVLGPVGTLSQTPPPDARLRPSVLLQKNVQARIDSLIPEAKRRGSVGLTLVDYGTYQIQLSVRAASGGAEVHAHWDDVMTVEEGSATLVTGGTVVDGKTDADGETRTGQFPDDSLPQATGSAGHQRHRQRRGCGRRTSHAQDAGPPLTSS